MPERRRRRWPWIAGIPFLVVVVLILLPSRSESLKVVNDTAQAVRLVECSQDRPNFPGVQTIAPGETLTLPADALPSDDRGAACFLQVAGPSADAGCLRMSTDDNDRTSYRVSEADRSLARKACMDLSNPGPP
jgi:hypothetical protein